MVKFISISTFSALYSSQTDLLNSEGLQAFIDRLRSDEGVEICGKNGIELGELDVFISSLNTPEHIVFYGWISQNKMLEGLLVEQKLTGVFEDRAKHLEHHLAEAYKRFISPFLAEVLLHFAGQGKSVLARAFSFAQLLDNDHNALVETQLFKSIQLEIQSATISAKTLLDEQQLVDLVKPLCSDDVITCVNYLSRPMYATKLNYVDYMLSFIRSKSCTTRFANWSLKRMEEVKLNKEHAYKINDLRGDLRQGAIQVRNNLEKGRTPFRWKTLFMGAFIVSVIVFVIAIIVYKPFSNVEGPELSENTSFKQFTQEEREKIDSLLKEMDGHRIHENDLWLDTTATILGTNTPVVLRQSFKNNQMESLYADLSKDADLQELGYADTCVRAIQYKRLKGVKDLLAHDAAIETMFRNDSDYDAVVFLAEEKTNGTVYSAMIKSGEIKIFHMDQSNTLVLVVGNTYQRYSPPSGFIADELPSTTFTHHFCDTDANYKESINTAYRVENLASGKTKFLLQGKLGEYVSLIDIYDVLEPL